MLKPYAKKHEDDEDGAKKKKSEKRAKASGKKKRILDSEDESSEEDFFFLEKALKDSAELDEVDRRLLVGIVQAPPKEKKRWDKEDPAEIRQRRREKAIARGEHYSDSYDDETDPEGEEDLTHINDAKNMFSTGKDGDNSNVDLLGGGGKDGKSMMHAVMAARNKAMGRAVGTGEGEVQLPCPDGHDPLKWASMSRKEKMKVLGISEKEWNNMTREQQMKRMNKLAHGFHFYAMKGGKV